MKLPIGIPNFDTIKISTKTIIAVTNMTFNLNLLYNYLNITDWVVIKKKRGRKKKVEVPNPNKDVGAGSIISVVKGPNVRGVVLKKNKKSKTYFLNSITIVLILEFGKMINVKVSQNGKFQITGCKEKSHYTNAIEFIYKKIKISEKQIGEQIVAFKSDTDKYPKVIFNIVMKNIDFKVGFSVQREKVDTFINENTEFFSLFEGSVNTGVNIKLKSKHPHDNNLTCMEILENSNKQYLVPFTDYLEYLDEKETKKELKKEKYHTFLLFNSGSCIQSGSGPDMAEVYNDFMTIIQTHRKEFEEKLDPIVIY